LNRALLIPIGFGILAAFLLAAIFRNDASVVPSALIGRKVPQFELAALEGSGLAGLSSSDFGRGSPVFVNVWASWCVPCRAEHPLLKMLATKSGAKIYGINYKDQPAAAARFLQELGNPFARIGADVSGRVGIDWGVYGVPETYLVDAQGRIAYKHVGPLTQEIIDQELLPLLQK
jgi:cytochrome c biogenesis protein CcmG/thiol:disulfide interchange protein DsbE